MARNKDQTLVRKRGYVTGSQSSAPAWKQRSRCIWKKKEVYSEVVEMGGGLEAVESALLLALFVGVVEGGHAGF